MAKRKAVYNPAADSKWREENKAYASYLRSRSSTKSFIRNKATLQDIKDIEEVIEERKKFLEKSEEFIKN